MTGRFRVVDTGVREGRFNIAVDQAMIELHQAGRIPDTLRFMRFPPTASTTTSPSASRIRRVWS